MDQRSIKAYDLPQRVESYDADMDLMHPDRSKVVQSALDILPFPSESPLFALRSEEHTSELQSQR